MNILLTGGLGYIGSHTAITLAEAGHQILLLDNLSNSDTSILIYLEKIIGKKIIFIEGDVRDKILVSNIFQQHAIDAVIHFAGLKSVHESMHNPMKYYDHNVNGSLNLIKVMEEHQVKKIVFSSSATVYGEPVYLPYDESHPTHPINVYGHTKLVVEQMLTDLTHSDPAWSVAILRYFNPVGAHESGLIGEKPQGIPNNLMPYLTQVASGKLKVLRIFGDNYDTRDGTGERDYIHVMDLAEGHLAALQFIRTSQGCYKINLGSGQSTSVLELINAFEKVNHQKIPYEFTDRRQGDLPAYYAKADLAAEILQWNTSRSIESMCESAWLWEKNNVK